MKRHWKVGDLAKLTGLTIRTLRFYDQIGLFSPSDQTESGHRLYTESDVSRLHQILALKDLGLSLEETKSVLAQESIRPAEILALQIDRLKSKIAAQQKLLEELERASGLLKAQDRLAVDDFTRLLLMMKQSHERFFLERKLTMESRLDRLGAFLADRSDEL